MKFAFSLFDIDGGGYLEMSEVRALVQSVYGSHYKNNRRIARIIELVDKNDDGMISFEEFQDFNRNYPIMLFPSFQMQNIIRERLFGYR